MEDYDTHLVRIQLPSYFDGKEDHKVIQKKLNK